MKHHRLLFAVVAVLLLGGYWLFLARNHMQRIEELYQETRTTLSQVESQEQKATQLEGLTQSVQQLEDWRQQVLEHASLDPLAPSLLAQTTILVEANRLTTLNAEVQPSENSASLQCQEVTLTVSGGFQDLFRFVHAIESFQPTNRVTSLKVQRTTEIGRVRADLSVVRIWGDDA